MTTGAEVVAAVIASSSIKSVSGSVFSNHRHKVFCSSALQDWQAAATTSADSPGVSHVS